jgi:hypothetical protein
VPQVASCIPPTRCLLPALLLPRSLCGNSVLSNALTAVPPTLRADDAPLTPPSTHTQCPFLLLKLFRKLPGMPAVTARMASTARPSVIPPADLADFQRHLNASTRILALVGAGLSASSGLPTFRGAGGLWRTHEATELATPGAFQRDPALVWQFYSYRRHVSLKAPPNRAHYALAELARRREGFLTLSQNVDGTASLSPPT